MAVGPCTACVVASRAAAQQKSRNQLARTYLSVAVVIGYCIFVSLHRFHISIVVGIRRQFDNKHVRVIRSAVVA